MPPGRLSYFGLEIEEDKTRLIEFGGFAEKNRNDRRKEKIMKKYSISVYVLVLALLFTMIGPCAPALAKTKIRLNNSKLTLHVGDKAKLKLSGAKASKVSWKSSKKKVAAVSKAGKVTAKSKGKCKVTATYKKKKYSCSVSVKKNVPTGDTELDRAVSLGIAVSAADKASITGKQLYSILDNMVKRIDASKLAQF